jgi:TubC N-terminal docking domain
MNASDLVKAAQEASLELYLEGERLRYRSPHRPDPMLLNLVTQHKADIMTLLEQQTMLPQLPWQLRQLVIAACSGVLDISLRGVPNTSHYVMAWVCEYLVSSQRDEPLKRLWEVYAQW